MGVKGAATIADYTTAAPGRGVFTSFGIFSVSRAETAFSAVSYLSGTSGDTSNGLLLYRGGSLLDVAAVGEPLFGSTISSLSLATSGLDGDTLTSAYVLADGVSGVATFSAVPGPSTWALVGLGALVLVGYRKRRCA